MQYREILAIRWDTNINSLSDSTVVRHTSKYADQIVLNSKKIGLFFANMWTLTFIVQGHAVIHNIFIDLGHVGNLCPAALKRSP